MTINDIIKLFNKEKPNLTVIQIIKETSKSFIVCAVPNPNERNFDGSYYRVTIWGTYTPYNVTDNIDKFVKLATSNTIYKYS